jgi:hypothetical protein
VSGQGVTPGPGARHPTAALWWSRVNAGPNGDLGASSGDQHQRPGRGISLRRALWPGRLSTPSRTGVPWPADRQSPSPRGRRDIRSRRIRSSTPGASAHPAGPAPATACAAQQTPRRNLRKRRARPSAPVLASASHCGGEPLILKASPQQRPLGARAALVLDRPAHRQQRRSAQHQRRQLRVLAAEPGEHRGLGAGRAGRDLTYCRLQAHSGATPPLNLANEHDIALGIAPVAVGLATWTQESVARLPTPQRGGRNASPPGQLADCQAGRDLAAAHTADRCGWLVPGHLAAAAANCGAARSPVAGERSPEAFRLGHANSPAALERALAAGTAIGHAVPACSLPGICRWPARRDRSRRAARRPFGDSAWTGPALGRLHGS